ncbi:hypothetical protein F4778DRAFT_63593 [Xylariomycetidae sp. FL2044]|nr:hypothetical protein F4778DRAFT_63593 [Xylariomycetidae sp. FL2044]
MELYRRQHHHPVIQPVRKYNAPMYNRHILLYVLYRTSTYMTTAGMFKAASRTSKPPTKHSSPPPNPQLSPSSPLFPNGLKHPASSFQPTYLSSSLVLGETAAATPPCARPTGCARVQASTPCYMPCTLRRRKGGDRPTRLLHHRHLMLLLLLLMSEVMAVGRGGLPRFLGGGALMVIGLRGLVSLIIRSGDGH